MSEYSPTIAPAAAARGERDDDPGMPVPPAARGDYEPRIAAIEARPRRAYAIVATTLRPACRDEFRDQRAAGHRDPGQGSAATAGLAPRGSATASGARDRWWRSKAGG